MYSWSVICMNGKKELWDGPARDVSAVMMWLMMIRDLVLNRFYRTCHLHFICRTSSCSQCYNVNTSLVLNSKSAIPCVKPLSPQTVFLTDTNRKPSSFSLTSACRRCWRTRTLQRMKGEAEERKKNKATGRRAASGEQFCNTWKDTFDKGEHRSFNVSFMRGWRHREQLVFPIYMERLNCSFIQIQKHSLFMNIDRKHANK